MSFVADEAAALVEAVLERSTSHASRVHGEGHWKGVAAAALCLLDHVPGADPEVALLFALLHDAARRSDGYDRHHGERGAELARELHVAGVFGGNLDAEMLTRLVEACAYHEKGYTHSDPTIGVCWDAARLNLWRVGRKPNASRLSTEAVR